MRNGRLSRHFSMDTSNCYSSAYLAASNYFPCQVDDEPRERLSLTSRSNNEERCRIVQTLPALRAEMVSQLLINLLCLAFAFIGFVLSGLSLVFIAVRVRPLTCNIPLILSGNTYAISFVSSCITLIASCQTIYAIFTPDASMDTYFCRLFAYCAYASIGSVFYSFILQALFRLLRIVFYVKSTFRSLRRFSVGIVVQWLIVGLLNLPFLLLGDFQYVSSEFRCQISYTNFRASLLAWIIEYLIPTNIIFVIYFCIIRYIRRTNRGVRHRRDVIVMKQMLGLLVIVQFLSVPLSILWALYLTTNYLTPLSYQIQGLTVAFSQAFTPIALAFCTAEIREKLMTWKLPNRVQPIRGVV